jgi:hypothetical protein
MKQEEDVLTEEGPKVQETTDQGVHMQLSSEIKGVSITLTIEWASFLPEGHR